MTVTLGSIPEADYFSFEEIAEQWDCNVSDIEQLVFHERTLRAAIVSDTVHQLHDNPDLWDAETYLDEDYSEDCMVMGLPRYMYIDFGQFYSYTFEGGLPRTSYKGSK